MEQTKNILPADAKNLKIIAILYRVVSGFALFAALFPFLHLFMGINMINGYFQKEMSGDLNSKAMLFLGIFFILFATTWIICAFTYALFMSRTAKYLTKRKKYKFCIIMAGITCAFFPLGTMLGGWTIALLNKDPIRELFVE